jgi:hypothetical protein
MVAEPLDPIWEKIYMEQEDEKHGAYIQSNEKQSELCKS